MKAPIHCPAEIVGLFLGGGRRR